MKACILAVLFTCAGSAAALTPPQLVTEENAAKLLAGGSDVWDKFCAEYANGGLSRFQDAAGEVPQIQSHLSCDRLLFAAPF
jgi:hypothetical protein